MCFVNVSCNKETARETEKSIYTENTEPSKTSLPEKTAEPQKTEDVVGEKIKEFNEIFTSQLSGIEGNIQWKYKIFGTDIESGEGSGAVHSASVIKIFIMEYAFMLSEKGEIDFSEKISYDTIANFVEKMIIYSDNDATNVLIDYFGMEKLNVFFKESGYVDTEINRKMLDETSRKNGIDNFTSANDVFRFLYKLYLNRDVYPYREMLEIMKKNHGKGKIADFIPEEVSVANKPGENDDIDNDIGIIFTDNGDVAIAVFCTDIHDKPTAQKAISTIGELIYKKILDV